MPQISPRHILFLVANIAFGALMGIAFVRVPALATSAIPIFGWLVAGVLAIDLIFGYLAGAHPTAVITMPVRIAALVLSYVASFIATGALAA